MLNKAKHHCYIRGHSLDMGSSREVQTDANKTSKEISVDEVYSEVLYRGDKFE